MASETAGSAQLTTRQLLKVAQTAETAGDMDRALGFFRALCEIDSENPRWAFEAVRILNKTNRHVEAKAALGQALRKFPKARSRPDIVALVPKLSPTTADLTQALGADCPPDEALKRATVEDDGYSDCIVARGGRKAAVIVFTGLADRIVMPLPLFDRYLAELDLTAIYLRDQRRAAYFNGVTSLGEDYDGTIVRLKEMLVDQGALSVHTIGNSAGGVGAISYGLDLHAKRMLAFSSPLMLTEETAQFEKRANTFLNRMLEAPPERRRFRERLMAKTGRTEAHLFYGQDMPEDRIHAEAMAEAPCVTLHPMQGLAGHGALFRMAEQHGLRKLFSEMFGEND